MHHRVCLPQFRVHTSIMRIRDGYFCIAHNYRLFGAIYMFYSVIYTHLTFP